MKHLLLLFTLFTTLVHAQESEPQAFDVIVYGGTPAGIAAACASADEGRTVLLAEPYSFLGGLVTNGLTHADFKSLESLTGFWWDFTQRVKKHYADAHGPDSPQVKACFEGNFAEPKVNRLIFEKMLAERKGITVLTGHTLRLAATTRSLPSSILSVTLREGKTPNEKTFRGKMYVDASYEGDLMAAAGAKFTIGREDAKSYDESQAKDVPAGGDGQVQGYNFRWCMTKEASNKVPAPKPAGYKREEFLPLLELFEDGTLTNVFGIQHPNGLEIPPGLAAETTKAIYKVQPPLLPNGKTDINDMSRGTVRLSMPDINDGYPAGGESERLAIFEQHVRYQVGMLYFLQNDSAVPEAIKTEANTWGFCKDEWPENQYLPEQLYVREARRMIGRHIFTENDTRLTDDDVRVPLQKESIGIGDYSHNCHGTGRTGGRYRGKHVGEFYKKNPPFQIAYGTLVPNEVSNLLVPVAASSSHVGFGALRLEPTWAGMGYAAGFAAHLALQADRPSVHDVSIAALQKLLHQHQSATIYVSDVSPGHPDFAAVQWIGMLGGLHGLYKPVDGKHPSFKSWFGQYSYAMPQHEAALDKPLDDLLRKRWTALLSEALRSKVAQAAPGNKATTRGEWLRMAWAIASK